MTSSVGKDWECKSGTCPICGLVSRVMVPTAALLRWRNGAFAQDAFPMLSAGERETVISGAHEACFDAVFAPDDDEPDWPPDDDEDDIDHTPDWLPDSHTVAFEKGERT